ncbi:MAG: hypothetical protein U0T69_11120 [Chitinophagales bacterium]
MKADTGFANYDKQLFADVRKSIKGLRNGYKDLAYHLYAHELEINNSVLTDKQKKITKEVLFKRVNGKPNPILQSYIGRIKLSLNHKLNPAGTVNTEWVIKNTIALANSQKNQKIQWSSKIKNINTMPDEVRDNTDYSAIDEHTRRLEENQ